MKYLESDVIYLIVCVTQSEFTFGPKNVQIYAIGLISIPLWCTYVYGSHTA